ncbi:ABC transporter substrate-binding protein [Roseinatronobacter sp. S2]|uniref:ABC transporter substrate-binding protein n=1 Tax=Roseinatronobacter sp. S2 TaxID=3035471 RepID=UPI002410AB75|nr:ABC transporter substrate-binding protein [Roseinatronobacter sp. S2]WFE74723.1 ABC transporter substrate-binding protein [Roseinatronobacter sp. S2]
MKHFTFGNQRARLLSATLGVMVACAGPALAQNDNTFVYSLATAPSHLNMGITTDGAAGFVSRALHDPLVNLNRDFEMVPALARSWSVNDDSTEYTFNLVENAVWHDGAPFTSRDVKFYFDTFMAIHPLGGPIYSIYEETLTPDDYTVIVRLSEPFGPLVEAMSAHIMLPAHLYEGTDVVTNPANIDAVGTGPYRLENFDSGNSVTLVKNEDYWGEHGDVDRIVYQVMPDANSRNLALQSGNVDLVPTAGFQLAQKVLFENNPQFWISMVRTQPQSHLLFFNTRKPILEEADVRHALFHAIDREQIARVVYMGTAEPSRGPIPNQVAWTAHPDVDFTETFAFDPARAEEMLDAAGYERGADGTRFSLRLNYRNDNPVYAGTAEVIASNLEQIGVKINLLSQDPNISTEFVYVNHEFDIHIQELAAFADPTLGVARAYVCNSQNRAFANPTGVCDPDIDAAFAAAAKVADREQRIELFAEASAAAGHVLGTAPLVSALGVEVYRGDKWDGLEEFTAVHRFDWSKLRAK